MSLVINSIHVSNVLDSRKCVYRTIERKEDQDSLSLHLHERTIFYAFAFIASVITRDRARFKRLRNMDTAASLPAEKLTPK